MHIREKRIGLSLLAALWLLGFAMESAAVAQSSDREARTLRDGSCLRLRLAEEVNSGTARVGELVHFEVTEELRLGEAVVLAKGNHATGVVTAVEHKGRIGGDGLVQIAPKFAQLADGEEVALRSTATGAAPAGPTAKVHGRRFFSEPGMLLRWWHGREGSIAAGTEFTAYINGDMRLDAGRFARLTSSR